MNCPWFLKPALAASSVIPSGSILVTRASWAGFFDIFADSAFG